MSDANLLAYGAGVSFIVLAGVYAYLRESFLAGQPAREQSKTQSSAPAQRQARESV